MSGASGAEDIGNLSGDGDIDAVSVDAGRIAVLRPDGALVVPQRSRQEAQRFPTQYGPDRVRSGCSGSSRPR